VVGVTQVALPGDQMELPHDLTVEWRPVWQTRESAGRRFAVPETRVPRVPPALEHP